MKERFTKLLLGEDMSSRERQGHLHQDEVAAGENKRERGREGENRGGGSWWRLKFSLYYVFNDRFQYSDLEAPGCLPYSVMRLYARYRCHLRNVQYGGLEALGCLLYTIVRSFARSRDHLMT
jgi:hypothetical protein